MSLLALSDPFRRHRNSDKKMVDRSFRALTLLPLLLAASGKPLSDRGAGVPEDGPLRRLDHGDPGVHAYE